jgi:LEA14-like dessication related protein
MIIPKKTHSKVCIGLIIIILATTTFACKSISQGKKFAKCQFRATTMEQINLAGVTIPPNIQNVSDIGFLDAAKITATFLSGAEMPLSFIQNVEVENPNEDMAAINRLDWILFVDDKEITQGTHNQRTEVQPKSITNMPLQFQVDLRKVINSGAADAFLNLVMNLTKQSKRPSRIKLKVKPHFNVLGATVAYPGYISLTQEFSANQQ